MLICAAFAGIKKAKTCILRKHKFAYPTVYSSKGRRNLTPLPPCLAPSHLLAITWHYPFASLACPNPPSSLPAILRMEALAAASDVRSQISPSTQIPQRLFVIRPQRIVQPQPILHELARPWRTQQAQKLPADPWLTDSKNFSRKPPSTMPTSKLS